VLDNVRDFNIELHYVRFVMNVFLYLAPVTKFKFGGIFYASKDADKSTKHLSCRVGGRMRFFYP